MVGSPTHARHEVREAQRRLCVLRTRRVLWRVWPVPGRLEAVRTLAKVFGLYEGGRVSTLRYKPLVSRYVQNSDVATCQDASLLLGYTKRKTRGCVSTRDSKKGLRRVLI